MADSNVILLYDLDPLLNRAICVQASKFETIECLKQSACSQNELLSKIQSVNPIALFLNPKPDDFQIYRLIKKISDSFCKIKIFCYLSFNNQRVSEELLEITNVIIFQLPFSVKKFQFNLNSILPQQKLPDFINYFQKQVLSLNFLNAYESIPTLCQKLFLDSKNQFPQKELDDLLSESTRLMGYTDPVELNKISKLLNIHVKHFLMTDFEVQIYLFYLYDLTFQRRAIQRCEQLRKIFKYINEHIYDDISISQIADNCGISHNYLGRLFMDKLGIGLNNYIQIKKIQIAKESFYFNEDKIIDVCFKLSYSEPGYFSKVFKKIEKMTPSQYKRHLLAVKKNTMDVMK